VSAKYIFVTGGVLSGVGKGITAASIGRVLKSRGISVSIQKCDPYLNTDAGTLNPAEHGECFVTKDGAETDLDLGHYERFLDIEMTRDSSLMNGRVLRDLIEEERSGKFLGKTVQIVPHLTSKMVDIIIETGSKSDVHIVEIGGTVGDIEGMAFIEAIRQLGQRVGIEKCIYAHVVYVPYLGASEEYKTKPAQNALSDLRATGIQPSLVVARTEKMPTNHQSVVDKISIYSSVSAEGIIVLPNLSSIYEVPGVFEARGLGDYIAKRLNLDSAESELASWSEKALAVSEKFESTVSVAFVAKYLDNKDTYISVFEALRAAGAENEVDVEIKLVDAESLDRDNASDELGSADAVLVPGGFGSRGIEGKIIAADFAFRKKIPYLGICLGLQVAAIAGARRAGHKDANSTEFNPSTGHPVVSTIDDQIGREGTGGTMRLGDQDCILLPGSRSYEIYGKREIVERHRHRYEINPEYIKDLKSAGLIVSGIHPVRQLIEMMEAGPEQNHPFYVGTQAHPEFRSRPSRAHPLFKAFIAAAKCQNYQPPLV
jgi:CTP synthase